MPPRFRKSLYKPVKLNNVHTDTENGCEVILAAALTLMIVIYLTK
jgi:hypothetical protein